MSLELWLPPRAEPKWMCRVPTGERQICGARFFAGQERAYERHVVQCAKEHHEIIHNARPSEKLPWYYKPWDAELEAFVKRTGRI